MQGHITPCSKKCEFKCKNIACYEALHYFRQQFLLVVFLVIEFLEISICRVIERGRDLRLQKTGKMKAASSFKSGVVGGPLIVTNWRTARSEATIIFENIEKSCNVNGVKQFFSSKISQEMI